MTAVPDYVFDPSRLAALDSYAVLDTNAEIGFDDIVQLAMFTCETPVALVSLVARDRQWFKARSGFEMCETDLNGSVCAHALIESDLLIITDLNADPRTASNPLVTAEPHIRFYAGAPLRTEDGHVLGSLCVIDSKPRPGGLTVIQAEALRNLARQVMTQLELRKALVRQRAFLAAEAEANQRRAGLLGLVDKLRDLSTSEDMTRAAATIVGETLGAIRAGFGALSEDGEFVDVESDWTTPGVPSVAGRHRFSDYGRLADDILAGRPLVVEDVVKDPRTAANPQPLLDHGVRSLLNVAVHEGGRPVAIFYAHFDSPRTFTPETIAFLCNVADRVEIGVARLKAEAQQRVLNHELSHRMKNSFAMVQAIASQTLKNVSERGAVDAFISRLHALSSAHEVLLKQSWLAADIVEVVRNVIGAVAAPERFVVSGLPLTIGPRATLSLSLLMHELATNAIKYGSLSVAGGSVAVTWQLVGASDQLVLSWREHNGPALDPPSRQGFGSRLIRMGLVGTGGADLRYLQSGFEADFRASLLEVQST